MFDDIQEGNLDAIERLSALLFTKGHLSPINVSAIVDSTITNGLEAIFANFDLLLHWLVFVVFPADWPGDDSFEDEKANSLLAKGLFLYINLSHTL
ncbi:unnamed protein product [Protopolystoma xenopodis]|uniref:Uncharacterized protein n=1 Tax=Protopolystoma xenopodis TaxID=117903 RepID=A0A448XNJ9_9PLAT|nr:unnamed protein product [Protopolystoma xenopodis]